MKQKKKGLLRSELAKANLRIKKMGIQLTEANQKIEKLKKEKKNLVEALKS